MQNQDHKKIHSPGLENHGVYVCRKCGWPFPNPHPSAKHRRAHKRVCGKVGGYKLIESDQENPNLGHSDDDHKTTSPKVLETSKNEKGSGGSAERLKRSEDELFSDAVMEFSDGVQGAGTNEHAGDARDSVVNVDEMIAEKESSSTRTDRDGQIAGLILSPGDNSQLQDSELQKSTVNQPDTAHVGTSDQQNTNVVEDRRTGGFVLLSDRENNTEADSYPIKSETSTAESQENMNTDSGDNVTECSLTSDVQRTDEQRNEAVRLDTNLQEVVIFPGNAGDGASQPLQKIEETVETTSDPSKFDGVQLNDVSVSVYSELLRTDVPPEVEVEPVNEEGNENVHFLSVPDDLNVVDHPEALIQDFKDHNGVKLQHSAILDSHEIPPEIKVDASSREIPFLSSGELLESKNKKEGNENVNDVLHVHGDLNVVEHPEAVKDFQDQNDVKDPISKESSTANAGLSNEGSDASSLHKEVVRSSLEQESEGSNLIDGVPIVEEVNITKIEITPNEIQKQDEGQASFGTMIPITDNSHTFCSSEEQKSSDTSKDPSIVNFPKEVTEVQSNVDPMDICHTGCSSEENASNQEKQINAECALARNENSETAAGSSYIDDTACTHESAKNISEFHFNLTTDVHYRTDFDNREESRIDQCDIAVIENREGPIEQTPTTKLVVGSEELQIGKRSPTPESTITDKDGLPDLSNVYLVSGADQSVKEDVADSDGLAQTEHVGFVSTDAQSFFLGDANSEEKTTKDHMKKEQQLKSVDTESFLGSATVEDNHAREFLGDVASSKPLLEKCDNNAVKPQLSPCQIDISVDSSSQTDSLEANWGSVSVLSTLSDLPAVTDAAEAEKTNLEKGKATSNGQRSEKSDMFEPPSFMTLVEHGGEGNQNAADSEIQTEQNPQQPQTSSLQAGWFPSVTHTANDSPGRKNNEAIIAKVTNWTTGRQHSNLRSLLGEAALENKMKASSTSQESEAPVTHKNKKEASDNGVLSTKADPITGPELLNAESDKREVGREWDSPARYPSDIKREKRKVRGRPIWTQFVCCSSVN